MPSINYFLAFLLMIYDIHICKIVSYNGTIITDEKLCLY